jgi:hypothetical protein
MKKILLATFVALAVVFGFFALACAEVNMFGTGSACISALSSGTGTPYVPKHLGLHSKDPVNNSTRVARELETDACVRMKTTAGVQWVIQPKGTVLRWNVNQDGSLSEPYARDDCGNPINGISYPMAAAQQPQGPTSRDIQAVPPQQQVVEQQYVPPQYREVRAGVRVGFLGFFGLEASTNDNPPQLCAFGCPPPTYVSGGGYPVGVAYAGGVAYTGSYVYTGSGYRSHGGGHGGYRPHPRYSPPPVYGVPPGGHTGQVYVGTIGGGNTGRAR